MNIGGVDEGQSLHIDAQHMVHAMKTSDTLLIEQLPSFESLEKDQLFNRMTQDRYTVVRLTDSTFTGYVAKDTLFRLDPAHRLLQSNGNYFLNTQLASQNWSVDLLRLHRGLLTLNALRDEQEVRTRLNAVQENDTVPYFKAQPTRRAFRQLVNNKGFETYYTFFKATPQSASE